MYKTNKCLTVDLTVELVDELSVELVDELSKICNYIV